MVGAKKAKPAPPPTNVPLDASGRQLFDAVLRDPEDIEARLVFSDWLTEHGDPRGEFIQLQCALNRPLNGAKARTWHRPLFDGDPAALVKRERALIKLYEKHWLLSMRPFIRTWRWSRGFVDYVVADSAKFLDGVETIFANTPLVDVQLTALKKPMLRALDVNSQKFDAEALASFDSRNWSGVRRLNLSGNRFAEAGAKVLAGVRGLGGVTTLAISNTQLTDECIEVLVHAPFFSQLVDLELGWNRELTGHGALLVARVGRALKKLRLRATGVTVAEWKAIAEAAPQLEYVHVSAGFTKQVRPFFAPGVTVRE
jgi:uncharacterized protein (TIGR02996 family)